MIKKNIQIAAFTIFFAGLFWGLMISSKIILLFLLYFAVMLFINGVQKPSKKHWPLLLPILYFIFICISALRSENLDVSLFDMQVKMSFLLAPILFVLQKDKDKLSFNRLLLSFIIGATSSVTLLFVIKIFLFDSSLGFPKYSDFSSFIHPTYLSMYMTFSILACVHLWKQKIKHRNYLLLFVPLYLLVIYLADSKAGILGLVLISFYLIISNLYSYRKALSWGLLGFSTIIVILLFNFHPRFTVLKNVITNYEVYIYQPDRYVESSAERLQTWYASAQLISEKPVFGYGNGQVHDALSKRYELLGFQKSAKLKLNSHNQYLESWLRLGIFAFLLLIAILLSPAFTISKNKLSLYLGFILLISFNLLFESMLNKQVGIVFFTFFWCAFIASENSNDKLIKQEVYSGSTI